MTRIDIGFNNATAFHVGDNAYTVEVSIGGGKCAYHTGPGKFPYFTKDQAEALAYKVNTEGAIDPAHWTDGYLRPLQASDIAPRPAFTLA